MARDRDEDGSRPAGRRSQTLLLAAASAFVGLVAGIAVDFGRKAATQAAEAMTGDWIDALKAEHLEILELFDDLCETKRTEIAKRRRLLQRLRAILEKHAFEEEAVIYPALRLAGDEEGWKKHVLDHAEAKTRLYALEAIEPQSLGFLKTIQTLRRTLESHMHEEEYVVFPRLKAHLTPDAEARLTDRLHRKGVKLA